MSDEDFLEDGDPSYSFTDAPTEPSKFAIFRQSCAAASSASAKFAREMVAAVEEQSQQLSEFERMLEEKNADEEDIEELEILWQDFDAFQRKGVVTWKKNRREMEKLHRRWKTCFDSLRELFFVQDGDDDIESLEDEHISSSADGVHLDGLPTEIYFHLSEYLSPLDKQSLFQTSARLRLSFSPFVWKRCGIASDVAVDSKEKTEVYYRYNPQSLWFIMIPLRVFLNPHRYSWFQPKSVEEFAVDFNDMRQVLSDALLLSKTPLNAAHFPHLKIFHYGDVGFVRSTFFLESHSHDYELLKSLVTYRSNRDDGFTSDVLASITDFDTSQLSILAKYPSISATVTRLAFSALTIEPDGLLPFPRDFSFPNLRHVTLSDIPGNFYVPLVNILKDSKYLQTAEFRMGVLGLYPTSVAFPAVLIGIAALPQKFERCSLGFEYYADSTYSDEIVLVEHKTPLLLPNVTDFREYSPLIFVATQALVLPRLKRVSFYEFWKVHLPEEYGLDFSPFADNLKVISMNVLNICDSSFLRALQQLKCLTSLLIKWDSGRTLNSPEGAFFTQMFSYMTIIHLQTPTVDKKEAISNIIANYQALPPSGFCLYDGEQMRYESTEATCAMACQLICDPSSLDEIADTLRPDLKYIWFTERLYELVRTLGVNFLSISYGYWAFPSFNLLRLIDGPPASLNQILIGQLNRISRFYIPALAPYVFHGPNGIFVDAKLRRHFHGKETKLKVIDCFEGTLEQPGGLIEMAPSDILLDGFEGWM